MPRQRFTTTRRALVLVLLALLMLPSVAQGEVGSDLERRLTRTYATPFPAGPGRTMDDSAQYVAVIPDGVVVVVESSNAFLSLFTLTAWRVGTTPPPGVPARAASTLLSGPGTWIIQVDPTAGFPVDIRTQMRGHFADVGGAPAQFSLTDLHRGDACLFQGGLCLP